MTSLPLPLPRLVYRPEWAVRCGQDPQNPQDPQGEAPIVRDAREGGGPGAATGQGAEPLAPGETPTFRDTCLSQLPFFLVIGAILYFMLIRPQQKQEKARRQMLAAIKVGDEVVTSGGLHGTIASLTEATVTLRVDKVKMVFDRANIARVTGHESAPKPAG
jgi:preprotein translocase subunit YajC